MASSTWEELYEEVQSGTVVGIPEGTYNVEVADTRVLAKSRLIFLDLRVIDGPLAGKIAQVNLYVPEPGNRGAGFHFRNKIVGFGDLGETFRQMGSTEDIESALSILADALTGRQVQAEVELRSDGEYAGTNQLKSTKPTDAAPVPTTASAVTAANTNGNIPAPATVAAPAPVMADEALPF